MDYLNSPERKRKEKLKDETGSLMLNSLKNLSINQLLTESEISKMKVMRDEDTAQELIEDLEDIGIESLIRTLLNGKDMEAIITAFQKLSNEINARIASKLYSFFINSFEKFEGKAASNEADQVKEPKTKKAKVMKPSVETSCELNDSDDMSTSSDDDADDDVEKEDDDIQLLKTLERMINYSIARHLHVFF